MEDLPKELERLRKRAERERRARLEAEAVAEAGTRQIYERQRQLELLQVVTNSANSAQKPETCLQVALEQWCLYTSWSIGHAYFLNEARPRHLVSSRLWHIDQPQAFSLFREITERSSFYPGEGLPGRVLRENQSLWLADIMEDKNFPRAQSCPNLNLHAAFAFPVCIGEEVVSVLEFFSTEIQRSNELWVNLAAQVSAQIARVFERARAHAAIVDANTRLQREVLERQRAEEELRWIQPRLIEAGRAEVATGVLHNVGNVLNSVNISITEMRDHIEKSRVPLITKSAVLLQQNEANLPEFLTNDSKGKTLPGFLLRLGESITAEHQWLRSEMDAIGRHVEHIKNIVNTQQNYARVSGVTETIPPATIVEDALELSAQAFERHAVEVERKFKANPIITVDRHKTLQILINLLRNAVQAVHEANAPRRLVTVEIDEKFGGRIGISIRDTGVGISAENLAKIFRHGFTTKKYGHGFGLHSCALAAREMKGDLTVHSDGPGLGATFCLELPKQPPPT